MFHQITAQHTFFPSAHRTFSRIDHMLGHKCHQIQEDKKDGPMRMNTKYESLCIIYYLHNRQHQPQINHQNIKYRE